MNSKNQSFFLALLAIVIAVGIALVFRTNSYIMLLLTVMGIYIIANSGLDILFGYSGQISFGHAAFFAIGAYTSAILSKNFGISVFATLFTGAVFASVFGLLVAFPAAKLVHHFLALLTVAAGQIVYLVVSNAEGLTNGFIGINRIPPPRIGSFEIKGSFKYFFLVLVFVILFLYVKQRIIDSRTGRAFIAIRENSHAADGIGVNVMKYKIIAFVISAFYTGFAGALYAHLINFISPETFTMNQSVMFITMLLFGGKGSLTGPVIGAILIGVLQEYLQVLGNYQSIAYGILIIVVILFLPSGMSGIIALVRNKFARGGKGLAEN